MYHSPVIERITIDIADTLKTVRKVDGYANDFTVERIKVRGNTPTAGQTLIVVRQGANNRVGQSSQDTETWNQFYLINCYVDPAEDLTESPESKMNRVMADVEKVLTHTDQSRNRAGLADDTTLISSTPFADTGTGLFGCQIQVLVTYQTKEHDPYTSRYTNINP